MSPVSRGRRRTKSRGSGQRVLRAVPAVPDVCECAECSGEGIDLDELVGSLVAGGAELLEVGDPLEAELFAASLLAAGDLAGEDFVDAISEDVVPAVAAVGTPAALAVLLAFGDLPTATGAVAALVASGVPLPSWAAELREPVRLVECLRFTEAGATASAVLCTFERAGRSHGFAVFIDHTDCSAAVDIGMFPAEQLDEVVESLREDGVRNGMTFESAAVEPADLRWEAERAMNARTVHDEEDGIDPAGEHDEDAPSYHLMAALLRKRLRSLPEPTRAPAPHGD
ncbi:hypothetical protein [Actinoplanes sp. NPDC051494]|uniref:hypothetical protein n=1 Tax=Actinoplanes sp. NPDC051494 TaxID=3363907 RepID=UPI0037A67AA5